MKATPYDTGGPAAANPPPTPHAVAKGIWLAIWWGIKWAIIIQLAIGALALAVVLLSQLVGAS